MFKHLKNTTVTVLVLLFILTVLTLPAGCNDTQAKQNFVDEYISILKELESDPQIAMEGQAASLKYYRSGFTDLESAEVAMKSYEESIAKDEKGLKALENMNKPDAKSEEIVEEFKKGIEKVDEGNLGFQNALAEAPEQTVEERSAASADSYSSLSIIASGMESILNSMENLLKYIDDNSLEGKESIEEWHARIKSEYEGINTHLNQ